MSVAAEPRLPNTFLIGAPKCGTTSVATALGAHPNAFLPYPKEPGYFATDLKTKNPPVKLDSEADYIALFKAAPLTAKCIIDASVNYLFSDDAIPKILEFNRNAKFIVVLRSPVHQVIAQHQEQVFAKNENVTDFWAAWSLQDQRASGLAIPKSCADPTRLAYKLRSSLGDQLERCLGLIPREKLFIGLLDDLQASPDTFYRALYEFLDLPPQDRGSVIHAKASRAHRFPMFADAYQNPPSFAKPLMRVVKRLLRQSKLMSDNGLLRRALVRPAEKPNLSREQWNELYRVFEPQILKIEMLIQRDLTHWRQ